MSYSPNNPPVRIGGNNYAASRYPEFANTLLNLPSHSTNRIWEYFTGDSVSAVQEHDYFTDGGIIGMKSADYLIHVVEDVATLMIITGAGIQSASAEVYYPSPLNIHPVPALRALLFGHSYLDRQVTTASTKNRPVEYAYGDIMWANAYLGRAFEILQGQGIGGERLIDVATRVNLCNTLRPDIIFWNITTNDLKNTQNPGTSRATGLPYLPDPNQTNLQYAMARSQQLFKQLKQTGALIVLLPEQSPANGAADQSSHLAARTQQYNTFLRYVAMKDPQFIYVPLDTITYDVLNPAGNCVTDFFEDTIHISILGAQPRGKLIADTIRARLPAIDRLPMSLANTYTNLRIVGTGLVSLGDGILRISLTNVANGNTLIRTGDIVSVAIPGAAQPTIYNGKWNVVAFDSTRIDVDCPAAGSFTGGVWVSTSTNMFDNPFFVTQTGGSFSGAGTLTSGTVPQHVVLNVTAGSSVVIDNNVTHTNTAGVADQYGKWFDVTITAAANAAVNIDLLSNRGPTFPTSPYYGRLFAGDKVQALWDFEIVGTPTGLYEVSHKIAAADEVTSFYRPPATTTAWPQVAFRGVCGTAEWQTPASPALEACDGRITLTFTAAGGSARIRIGRVGVSRLLETIRDTSMSYNFT